MLRQVSSLFVFSLLSCFIFSCDKEETPDTAGPEITINSPKESQRMHRTITIDASAEDQSSEVSMKTFLDGKLLKETTENAVTADVDTETLLEGAHIVKVTATDGEGNTSEKSVSFEVRNTLFKVKISPNFLPSYTHVYYALSRNDGSLIAVEKVQNNGLISIPTPSDFNPDSSFVFTEYFFLHQPASEWGMEYLIKSRNYYAGMHAGEYKIAESAVDPSEVLGTHHVDITDIPDQVYSLSIWGKNVRTASYTSTLGTVSAELGLNKATSDLYFHVYQGPDKVPNFKYFTSIATGGSTQFSFTETQRMKEASVGITDPAAHFSYNIIGADGQQSFYSNAGDVTDGKIKIYYPQGIYPEFTFAMQYSVGSDIYENRLTASAPPSNFKYVTTSLSNVNYANSRLTFLASGPSDLMTISGGESNYTQTLFSLNAYYVTFAGKAKNEITIPDTPAELSEFEFSDPAAFAFNRGGIYDYDELSGENDYAEKLVFSSDNVYRYNRDYTSRWFEVMPTATNGRTSVPNKKIQLPDRLKTILRSRIPDGM